MVMKVEWIDHKREPQCAPNPEYPSGIDLDCSRGVTPACETPLPYPAKRCGLYYEDDEPNDNGWMPHGYGATEEEAIADLRENYE